MVFPSLPYTVHAPSTSPTPPYQWSGPTQVDTSSAQDVLPTALHAANGSIWLAWQTLRFSASRPDIVYKVSNGTWGDLNSGVWNNLGRLTSSNFNASPSLAQLQNGTVLLFWSSTPFITPYHFSIYYERCCTFNLQLGAYQWSTPVHLTTSLLNDTSPSATVGSDGSLRLFFERSSVTSSNSQIYYKTLLNGVWSADNQLTFDTSNLNRMPSGSVGKDGVIRLVFSKGPISTATYHIYYSSYNGTAWTVPSQIVPTSSGNSDEHASLMQDRNGTIWLFWGRLLGVGGSNPYYVLENQFSTNDAKPGTWSAVTQIGSEASGIDDKQPSVVQANSPSDKSMHVFISSDRTFNDYNIWAYNSPSISPVHDLGVGFVSPSPSLMYAGGLASIGESSNTTVGVTVVNHGDYGEKVQATVTVSNTTSIGLGSQTQSVSVGGSVGFFFSWNTTNAKPGRYNISVNAISTNSTETLGNQGDNSIFVKNSIHLLPWGDVDQDGNVVLGDVSVFFYDFGFTPATPSRWNPFCDINNNGIIDIIDVGVAVKNFGIYT